MELKDLKDQINDNAEENLILKSKAKLKSKVTSNLATSLDKSEFQDSLDKAKDNDLDHTKCLEEISTLKDLLSHARKVHDKWEGNTKVLDFLTAQSNNNMKMGLGHECYSRRDHSKCKPTSPELHDFRRRKYDDLPKYLICNYCGYSGHIQENCVKRALDMKRNTETNETFEEFVCLMKLVQNKYKTNLVSIRTDHGTEFDNQAFIEYWDKNLISLIFDALGDNAVGKPSQDDEEDMDEPDFRLSRDDPPELEEEEKEIEGTNDELNQSPNKEKRTKVIVDDTITLSQNKESQTKVIDNDTITLNPNQGYESEVIMDSRGTTPNGEPSVSTKWRYKGSHHIDSILGNLNSSVQTRRYLNNSCSFYSFLSTIEPTNIKEALAEPDWIIAIQEELQHFEQNKLDDDGIIVRNKARLVVQGYNQQEGIDYDETFAPIAQEVFVEQPPGFVDNKFKDHIFKLDKALYGLKQAPRAWYDRLSKFLLDSGFTRGSVDKTLFLKSEDSDLLVVQIYVDDIIFGSTNNKLCKYFSELMTSEFEMSMMGELKFFLGLQIQQTEEGIKIHQQKYVKETSMATPIVTDKKLTSDEDGKPVDEITYRGMIGSLLYLTASRPDIMILRYLIGTSKLYLWYPMECHFDLIGYSDADYAGCSIDRKSTSGVATFVGPCIITRGSKKQNSVALSTVEAEYIAAGLVCTQLLWLKQQLRDYAVDVGCIPILCDNTSAIIISKNPAQYSRTKHIEIRHHFIRDHVEKGNIRLEFCSTEKQWVDILTKALARERFETLRLEIGLIGGT
ncbi:hypothetical protein RND81_04G052800 [Saponaria officinalis]|uniref:Reverse transcriptase Ty1/copia-type domain-containing protein n=1 Tax=Saponaria officinalis TaxID=3572 RepID=A0AAW1LI98_SAPOF